MKRRIGESVFTPMAAGRVLARIADGESLAAVCGRGREAGLPERMTVYNWIRGRPGFAEAYRLAREAAAAMRAGVVEIGGYGDDSARWRRAQARRWAALTARLCEAMTPLEDACAISGHRPFIPGSRGRS